ncbi:MAG: methionyl-tRNA formyltransferase, partial [Clostridia bacterium]|nr:methionyl-tRNA formyltransferase [Clostridia bacterium]
MKIVFMGTPDYAEKTLEALIASEHEIAAVFCQPDKPVGRKQILTPPPVKVLAAENNIPVYQPNSVRTPEALEILKQINPDVIVVVAYGKILPKEILDLPKYGCVNGHASLLPKYRGAS